MRKVLLAVLLAASLTALAVGCGEQSRAGDVPDDRPAASTSPSSSPSGGTTIASRVVYFSSSAPSTFGAHAVVHNLDELSRYAQQATAGHLETAAEITAAGKGTDFSQNVLVGWTATTGCSAATAAALEASGDRLSLRVSQPEPPPECLRAFWVTVVFEVPKERMPQQPVFG
ncbi:hypothetical protein [Actinacidiphila sp. ITFR-21]|uniref:hypothetical protein n=1 Tax=Actinacidiphila sp. ITFR-21 TaxID=3075199 RepID=UPI00288AF008|nr:hypothetical protein [Streptomyces sp. ITFR-21]WNI15618.1 hypothetical protein RLT57_08790 [Streptomyces sp. ITFR-21]